jgi:serine/threonine-protein kinase
VRIHRFGEVDGLYYMAMQYVEGSDLAWIIQDYRASGEVMPITDTARVVQDITAALDYIHGKGVIHRDVKPHNIIVDSQGKAVLTDFGLALLSDLGAHGEMFGSPRYLAPEQAEPSGQVVPQSDLYSLGATLFEMLTGEVPFNGDNPTDLAMQHRSQLPPPPSQVDPAIPRSVDDVVLRSLEKNPYDRCQTGAELNAAFQRAIADWLPISASGDPAMQSPSPVIAWQETNHAPKLESMSAVPAQTASEIPQDVLTRPITLPEQIDGPTVAPVTQAAIPPVRAETQPTVRSSPPTRPPTSKIR